MKMNNDVYYLVKLDSEKVENYKLFSITTIQNGFFCGKIINQTSSNLYFELNGPSRVLVIIPHSWIKWMAPSKILWEKRRREKINESRN